MRSFFSHYVPFIKPRHERHTARTPAITPQPRPPRIAVKVCRGSDDVAPPCSKSPSRTGLLDTELLDELDSLKAMLPLMAGELGPFKTALKQMRFAEVACDDVSSDTERALRLKELELARQHLLSRVQRMQMVLQGHRQDLDAYRPNLRQVSHIGRRQNNWLRLERARKSLEAAPVQPPP